MPDCCPNPWCSGGPSVKQVCGDFDPKTDKPDLGLCFPYREKRDCDAPIRPIPECDDIGAYAELVPSTGKFVVIATIFDENCLPIQDENGISILGQF